MGALETLQAKYNCQILFVESGGDNLAANYSRELADYIIYVIDVSVCYSTHIEKVDLTGHEQGGDKIPRKGGPGISQSDLLVINKASFSMVQCGTFVNEDPLAQIDLAPHVNASLEVMDRDSKIMRGNGPTIFTSVKEKKGVDDVVALILAAWRAAGSPGLAEPVGDEKV